MHGLWSRFSPTPSPSRQTLPSAGIPASAPPPFEQPRGLTGGPGPGQHLLCPSPSSGFAPHAGEEPASASDSSPVFSIGTLPSPTGLTAAFPDPPTLQGLSSCRPSRWNSAARTLAPSPPSGSGFTTRFSDRPVSLGRGPPPPPPTPLLSRLGPPPALIALRDRHASGLSHS